MAEPIGRGRDQSLAQEIGVAEEEVSERKAFLQFSDEDRERLTGINEFARRHADAIVEEFYEHLLRFEDARPFFHNDPKLLESVKSKQKQYFRRLTEGSYDAEYVEDRLRIGAIHERIGLPLKWYLGMYGFYLRTVASRLWVEFAGQLPQALAVFQSLMKLVFLDLELAIDTYVAKREQTIRQQQEAIRELSMPVLQIRDGLLLLPLVGMIDAGRARQLTEQLLQRVRASRARVVVIDITGVAVVDSAVANHLMQTVEAVQLMGTTAIVTGVAPEIAQTLAGLGLDLSALNTMGDLQRGIEMANRMLV